MKPHRVAGQRPQRCDRSPRTDHGGNDRPEEYNSVAACHRVVSTPSALTQTWLALIALVPHYPGRWRSATDRLQRVDKMWTVSSYRNSSPAAGRGSGHLRRIQRMLEPATTGHKTIIAEDKNVPSFVLHRRAWLAKLPLRSRNHLELDVPAVSPPLMKCTENASGRWLAFGCSRRMIAPA